MVVHKSPQAQLADDEVDRLFRALADRTRRDIVRRTLVSEVTVSQLASAYDMSFAAVQKHVSVLHAAGLVVKKRHGRERLVSGNPESIHGAQALLDQFEQIWRDRVHRLDALLADDTAGTPTAAAPQPPRTPGPTTDPGPPRQPDFH